MLSKEEFSKKLAHRIKIKREEKGISQEELAHRAKVYRTYISHLEKNKYSPSSYVLYKIAKALNLNTSDLLW